jgi:hypothetical protein
VCADPSAIQRASEGGEGALQGLLKQASKVRSASKPAPWSAGACMHARCCAVRWGVLLPAVLAALVLCAHPTPSHKAPWTVSWCHPSQHPCPLPTCRPVALPRRPHTRPPAHTTLCRSADSHDALTSHTVLATPSTASTTPAWSNTQPLTNHACEPVALRVRLCYRLREFAGTMDSLRDELSKEKVRGSGLCFDVSRA